MLDLVLQNRKIQDDVAMNSVSISYRIKLNDDLTEIFDFELDEETFDLISEEIVDPPKWAKLEFRQCAHCPLNVEEHPYCPLALQLHNIVDRFHDTTSIDIVEMEVITEERKVIQTTAIQRAIASMLDLIFPICGCPKTEHMKPLARFHLPLASEEETVFRVTGMYLLAQYFLSVSKNGGSIEFDGLTEIYENMHTLNAAVASRLQAATRSDSAKNAITLLDMYSTLVPVLLEDELAEMRGFFQAYLPEGEAQAASTNYLEKAKAFSLELEPMDGVVDQSDDDRPEWLKELDAEKDSIADTAETEPKVVEESAADAIIKGSDSGISIELESIKVSDESDQEANIDGIALEESLKSDLEPEQEKKEEKKPEPATEEKTPEKESGGLSLSLEPIDGDLSLSIEDDKPKSSKATFKLPDE